MADDDEIARWLARGKRAADRRRRTDDVEEISRDARAAPFVDRTGAGDDEGSVTQERDRGERLALSKVEPSAWRHRLSATVRADVPQKHEAIGILERQRAPQHGMCRSEQRGVGATCESQRDQDDRQEAGPAAVQPPCHLEIGTEPTQSLRATLPRVFREISSPACGKPAVNRTSQEMTIQIQSRGYSRSSIPNRRALVVQKIGDNLIPVVRCDRVFENRDDG